MMKTVFKDSWVDGLLNQGRAEMLLELLEMRFSVPADIRKRVEKCNDTTQIKTWFKRVPSAASLDEIFTKLPARSSFARAAGLSRRPATATASSPSPSGHPAGTRTRPVSRSSINPCLIRFSLSSSSTSRAITFL
jgi:hypothetical protein